MSWEQIQTSTTYPEWQDRSETVDWTNENVVVQKPETMDGSESS